VAGLPLANAVRQVERVRQATGVRRPADPTRTAGDTGSMPRDAARRRNGACFCAASPAAASCGVAMAASRSIGPTLAASSDGFEIGCDEDDWVRIACTVTAAITR